MKGITLRADSKQKYLDLEIHPDQIDDQFSIERLEAFVRESDFQSWFFYDENIHQVANAALEVKGSNRPVSERIGECRNATVKFSLSEDEMQADVRITTAWGGKNATLANLRAKAKQIGIKRGLSLKRLRLLVSETKTSPPGSVLENMVAKGLPPRKGKSSRLKPLVPNALERILKPQTKSSSRVDMRDLGDVICVKANTPILQRVPPTKGRNGYSVTGTNTSADSGEWEKLRVSDGTMVSEENENILLAEITGMPKFKDGKMWVDDTFICKGVNVGTGNVNYDGAVLVNGDVTEKMEITASGDITVNGFVESAILRAGGDIIITEGAMGKVDDASHNHSCTLVAEGGIHIQHGQGLDLKSGESISIGKQLAYSRIDCGGGITVGPQENPNGNLFSCEIQCQSAVKAGVIGAVSGSHLTFDFSAGFEQLKEKQALLEELLTKVTHNATLHVKRIEEIKKKKIPEELLTKFNETMDLYEGEHLLMIWLQERVLEVRQAKEDYIHNIKLEASKKLYPGVVAKMNTRIWRAQKEYSAARIHYANYKWQFEPLL